jgi:hypothetical protein
VGHVAPEGVERISLILRYLAGRLIIEVSDPDPKPPVFAEADDDAEGGRGLMLVQALSKEWSYYLPPAGKSCTACSAHGQHKRQAAMAGVDGREEARENSGQRP